MADRLAAPEDLAALLQEDLDRATTETLIECATAVVQQACGQRIVQATSTITLDGGRGPVLDLPQRPVSSVDAVALDGADLDPDGWALRGNTLYRRYGWRAMDREYSRVDVTYTHGYAPGDQQLQLARAAVLTLAAGAYTNPSGANREQIGDYAIGYEAAAARLDAEPQLRRALLRHYGRPAGLITIGSTG